MNVIDKFNQLLNDKSKDKNALLLFDFGHCIMGQGEHAATLKAVMTDTYPNKSKVDATYKYTITSKDVFTLTRQCHKHKIAILFATTNLVTYTF